ncbi:MAG: metallopeptidase TldD-related protein [Peptococcaceae bacterium]|nr:metallopeptidase TldD-related protein [Peptococcaceae bacterium]
MNYRKFRSVSLCSSTRETTVFSDGILSQNYSSSQSSLNFHEINSTRIINGEIEPLLSILEVKMNLANDVIKMVRANIYNFIGYDISDAIIEKMREYFLLCKKASMKIQTAIERVGLRKIIISEGSVEKVLDSYIILSYNIFDTIKDTLVASDYVVSDSLDEDVLYNFEEIINNEICWYKKDKLSLPCSIEELDIFMNSASAGMFFHECVGHFLEADLYSKSPIRLMRNNIMTEHIGISENININYDKDDCGDCIKKNIVLMDDGRIKEILSSGKYDYLCDIRNTGNAHNENPQRFPLVRMREMDLTPSLKSIDEGLSETRLGVLVEKIAVGEANC